jgi:RNA polymerase sigma-70 factor (ECF subfamily)
VDLERRIQEHLARGEIDEAATAALRGYGPAILGYLCTLLPEDDARDVFSTFAENLWRGLGGFRGECSLRAWAYRLAWHAASSFRRDPYRKRKARLPTTAASRLAATVNAESGLAPGGRHARLGKLREALEPEERTLLVLRVDKELEWDEIAAVLSAEGHPVSSVALRKRFERLKEKLARMARDEGLLD